MKKLTLIACHLLLAGMITQSQAQQKMSRREIIKLADKTLSFAGEQYKRMATTVPDSLLPRTTNPKDGSLVTAKSNWWTCGFYPGTLWLLYEFSKDEALKKEALKRLAVVEKEQYNKGTHDLGFMMYCSFGNALRITKDQRYKDVLVTSARTLSTRFNPTVGCIKSWDHGQFTFPVIIDNMMNLELLTWATRTTGDTSFKHIATTHANTTIKNHFRKDYSSYHVIDYDPKTGAVLQKKTHQGAADSSAWSRGQAWGLYGYTMMYRETKDKAYLEQARHIADYMLNHPRMPKDLIPYYDYDAPGIPNVPRDASAAAVMASALLELSRYTSGTDTKRYWNAAEQVLINLASPAYLAKAGENNNFILMHSTGSFPHNSEVDVPLTYADYYFVEALLRYKQWAK
ncbi:glycoside hydrolase family 88 protein [Chitinophaga pendula]|uniref:glycoside hydrolase family 88 protein n=1 Tax=Chitinophaga TaxID=79328 RepID=UPI000BAFC62F|nr:MULTISPECIES: glycoside hydrolase family 88 protein [Chitinophaga]ASZ14553.1 glucuronyl hydrolase [Chitinophaga sp. MD30]UCJ07795.1 glycoside hydrolase family 88 protein [Chitinophaga pendula]